VPGFNISGLNDDPDSPANTVETDRNNRFRVRFGNITVEGKHVKSITRPTIRTTPWQMHWRHEEVNFPGKIKYEPLQILLYNHAGETQSAILAWFRDRIYDVDASRARDSLANRATVILEELDGMGKVTYKSTMLNAFIEERSGSPADHCDDRVAETVLIVRFDKLIEDDTAVFGGATQPKCKVDSGGGETPGDEGGG
jgi:hypothetical protein